MWGRAEEAMSDDFGFGDNQYGRFKPAPEQASAHSYVDFDLDFAKKVKEIGERFNWDLQAFYAAVQKDIRERNIAVRQEGMECHNALKSYRDRANRSMLEVLRESNREQASAQAQPFDLELVRAANEFGARVRERCPSWFHEE